MMKTIQLLSEPLEVNLTNHPSVQKKKLKLAAEPGRRVLYRVLMVILNVFKWIGLVLLAVFVAALVLISITGGPTHLAVSLGLGITWLALCWLLVMDLPRRHLAKWKTQTVATIGFIVLGLLTVGISQLSAHTPAILDAQGNPLPGSIATLEKVQLGGSDEWISIRAKSTANPVLLFLAGGPGGSQMVTGRYALQGLEDHFIVVQWDQPGSGKSFDAVDRSKLTPERYISDGLELVMYLRQRFGQDKVYLVGESWGSALGVWMVQRSPELFRAFVGTGQMVSFLDTEIFDYNFALDLARQRGDTNKVRQLEQQGPPPYYGNEVVGKQTNYLLDGFAYMEANPNITGGFHTVRDLLGPEYGLYDKVSWARGALDTLNVVYQQLWGVDLRKEVANLKVPVYFLTGRYDVNAPPSLTEDYYSVLQAPHKELIWFEHSGHDPWVSEPEKFVEVLVNKVLKDTQP
jgi:pimeloyl-ACP methyl ester carboxylesterase